MPPQNKLQLEGKKKKKKKEEEKRRRKKKKKKRWFIIVVDRFAGTPPKKSRNHGLAFAGTTSGANYSLGSVQTLSPPPIPSILPSVPKNAYFNTYDPPIQQNHVRFSLFCCRCRSGF
jgi:hypothetical protein